MLEGRRARPGSGLGFFVSLSLHPKSLEECFEVGLVDNNFASPPLTANAVVRQQVFGAPMVDERGADSCPSCGLTHCNAGVHWLSLGDLAASSNGIDPNPLAIARQTMITLRITQAFDFAGGCD